MTKRFDRAGTIGNVMLVHAARESGSGEHAHDRVMLFVPLSGSLRFVVGGKIFVADAHHALAIRAGTPHRHEPSAGVEYFIAYVDDAQVAKRATNKQPAFRFANTALVRELAAELATELAAADKDDEAIAAAALLLAAQAARRGKLHVEAPAPDDPRIAKALAVARAKYKHGVTSAELAKAAGMSTRTFERALAKAIGTSPRQLVEDLRLAEARTRLESGRESVTAVAFDLGYKSLSHFVRRFRRAFGVTPSQMG